MIIIARSVGLLVLGLLIGAACAAAWLGRYQVTMSGGDRASYVTRLDRWTGEVQGQAVIGSQHQTWDVLAK